MSAAIASEKIKHYPVLLNELISIISPQNGGTFIDCTFGQGGYSNKILQFPKTKVIAFDRDKKSIPYAKSLKDKFKSRFIFYNKKFSQISEIEDKNNIKGIIFDLGFSYSQIKDSSKGLSFNDTGRLNMKMGLNNFSAHDVISILNQENLESIFKHFGEEQKSKIISKKIVQERKKNVINTEDLVRIINQSKKNYSKLEKSTKIFQALRMFVNKEISELINGLVKASKLIEINGIIALVTFHSIEDKICKNFFSGLSSYESISRYIPEKKKDKLSFEIINKKPITASSEEMKKNFPSRSAKLRAIIKKSNNSFDTDFIFKKFQKLLNIEKLSSKL